MADVFLCESVEKGSATKLVALKRLHSHLLGDASMTGMLMDEVNLGRLCSHPNLVATLDSGQSKGQAYIVMEYVAGLDLVQTREALNARDQRFTRAEAVFIAMEITKGLAHLHGLTDPFGTRLGVVHRDVTPPNVLLGLDGSVKLCDYGFAKSGLQRTKTDAGLIKGKFSYLSPEATLEQPIDQRADLFSVGIMLWEMLTMCRLFHAQTDYDTVKLIQKAEVPSLESMHGDADLVLQEIVSKCLEKDPSKRFQSADALYNALAAYADWQELACDIGGLVAKLTPPQTQPAVRPALTDTAVSAR